VSQRWVGAVLTPSLSPHNLWERFPTPVVPAIEPNTALQSPNAPQECAKIAVQRPENRFMSNEIASIHDIPAPPAPGTADTIDEVMAGIPAPPQARRRVLTVLLSAISVASLALAFQFKDDVVYAMASTTPTALGDGLTASPTSAVSNQYVTLSATPSLAGAVTYSRPLFPGQHLVFPVAGRGNAEPIYIQVSDDHRDALTRGEFHGRLIPFNAAGGRYAGVGNYLQHNLNPRGRSPYLASHRRRHTTHTPLGPLAGVVSGGTVSF
jgi:hypothetical protein